MLKKIMQISPLYQQMFCHIIYILLAFKIHAQERPVFLILSMWLFILLLEMFIIGKIQGRKMVLPLASLVIGNSIYLNMEAYGTFYWPFFLAIFVSLAAKYLLRVDGRPVFNPSLIGVLFISTFLPQYGTAAMYAWNNGWIYLVLVFCLGTYVTYLSKTALLSYSYILSFFCFSLFCSYFSQVFPGAFSFLIPKATPLLLYPLSIFSFGNILFAFHGIGDPSTAPQSNRGKIIFGLSLGVLDFLLRLGIVLVAPFLAYAILLLVFGTIRFIRMPARHSTATIVLN